MAVETQWASRKELQVLTAAQDQVREQQSADRERIAKLEGQFGESDKRGATKADIADVRVEVESVRTEVESVRTEVESVRTEVERVRTEVERVRTEMAGVKKDVGVNRWLLYLVLSGLVLMLFRVFAGGFP